MQRPKAPTTTKRVIPGIGPVDPSSAKSTKKSSTSKWAPISDDDDLEGDWGVNPDAPFVEFKMNWPLGYHYYEYYDNNVAIVNGEPLPPPTWLRLVVIPTKFFDNDHVDHIEFPNASALTHDKDPMWFNQVWDYIHTNKDVKLYATMYHFEWSFNKGNPMEDDKLICSSWFR
jgi:hypothetical protein